MTIEQEINEIVLRKHDIALRLRSIAVDPIVKMNRPGAAEESYFINEGSSNRLFLQDVETLRTEFSRKWNDESKSLEEQKSQIDVMIGKVETEYVPKIREICKFYGKCVEKGFYFQSTENGNIAMNAMKKSAGPLAEELCADLLAIGRNGNFSPDMVPFNLLESLQEVLDDIDAYVVYVDELKVSDIVCKSDRKAFRDHVLMNIQENVNTHAFGADKYKSKHVWERIVAVSVSQNNETLYIDIRNNGAQFKGDVSKIFEDGYCHGQMKHTGHGMYSAKKTMEALGGDIQFSVLDPLTSEQNYTTLLRVILPK